MNTMIKLLSAAALTVGLSLPLASFADNSMTTTTSTQPIVQLAKVKMQYKDEQGHSKSAIVYVPKDKMDELHKAKDIQLLMVKA